MYYLSHYFMTWAEMATNSCWSPGRKVKVVNIINMTIKTVFKTAIIVCGAISVMASASLRAEETRLVGNQNLGASDKSLTIGSVSPVYGMITLPVSAGELAQSALVSGSSLIQDFAARYSTSIYGSEVGLFARFSDRPVFLSTATSTAFNLGASVGYGGFYLQGAVTGMNDNSLQRRLQSWQAMQAGFGYGGAAFDVRLNYAIGVSTPAFAGRSFDNSQWMLGGIYQFTPGIRFNADAFVGSNLTSPGLASAAPGASAPQGTGARVGVQLRF